MVVNQKAHEQILGHQRNEITEYHIYRQLAQTLKLSENRGILEKITGEQEAHEDALLAMRDEERLRYAGSMVLGLNDVLVELTGTLAGLSFVVGLVVREFLGVEI